MRASVTAAVLALTLAGCSPGGLTAELAGPVDIDLTWTADPAGAAGQVVEFATEPAGPWTILAFLPPGREHYRHPDLMPDTTFHYRIRPLRGAASAPVPVRLAAPRPGVEPAAPDLSWAEPRTVPDGPPTGLRATVKGPDAVHFTWAGTGGGEDGQLIEVSPDGGPPWTVAMALDPGVNSVGLMTLPTERRAWFRVRAFTYGPSSTVAHRTTGH